MCGSKEVPSCPGAITKSNRKGIAVGAHGKVPVVGQNHAARIEVARSYPCFLGDWAKTESSKAGRNVFATTCEICCSVNFSTRSGDGLSISIVAVGCRIAQIQRCAIRQMPHAFIVAIPDRSLIGLIAGAAVAVKHVEACAIRDRRQLHPICNLAG